MSGALEIVVQGSPEEPLLSLEGEIDLTTVTALRTAVAGLPKQPPTHLDLDLAGVAFMDSTGLGWLAQLSRDGCKVTLHGTPPGVRKVLEVTGVDAVVTIVDDDA